VGEAQPWASAEPEAVVAVVEEWNERRAYAEGLFGLPDDRAWQARFGTATPEAWKALKWDLVLACAPSHFMVVGLRLDALIAFATAEILRRLERQRPSGWGLIAALTLDLMPSTPTGRALRRRVFPSFTTEMADQLGVIARDALRRMAWVKVPADTKARLKKEDTVVPDLDMAAWKSVGELCRGRSVPEVLVMALRGKLNILPRRIANRVQDADDAARPEADITTAGQLVSRARTMPHRHAGSGAHVTLAVDGLGRASLEIHDDAPGRVQRLDESIDTRRALDRFNALAQRDHALRRGRDVLVAHDVDKKAWADLAREYACTSRTLQRARRHALRVLRGLMAETVKPVAPKPG
jgi:hypothetical protein